MVRTRLALIAAVALLSVSGCAAFNMPTPGGVFPGGIVHNVTAPAGLQAVNQVYAAYPDSFLVLGYVEGAAASSNVLGLFSMGRSGYRDAMDAAVASAHADGLINCVADVKQFSLLGIYSSSKTIVRGLAIKRK